MTLQTFCPACGAALVAGAVFCGSCGAQTTGGGSVATAAAAGDYAGFWMRFAAFIIDAIILMIPNGIIEVTVEGAGPQLLLRLVISALYFVGFWLLNDGATPGKMALGIKVQMANGGPIDAGPAVLRWIGYYVSLVILLIGYIMIAFTPQKRGLHDYIAGTVVVKTR